MGLLDSILSALGLRRRRPAGAEVDRGDADERDLELEARDDSGSFDFEHDIARYFTAEFRIETAWDNHPRRAKLFEEYGIRDTKHWHQIRATFERWLETPAAKAQYRTPNDLMQARMTTTQTMTLEDLNLERVDAGDAESADEAPALDAIEGVSLERWARAEAALEGGAALDEILATLELDEATWAEVASSWRARMDADASATIATEYSKHVGSAGAGKFKAKAGK